MCYRHLVLTIAALLSVSLIAQPSAFAQCGDPVNSTFPTHVTVCPSGDILVAGVVRDINGMPCSGTSITLEFAPPANNILFPMPGYSWPADRAVTRPNGDVGWRPRVGGCSPAGIVKFWDTSGVPSLLAQATSINSPDITGDGTVNLSDLVSFVSVYFGTYDPCADFNMDNAVNLSDLVIFQTHFGH